MRVAKRNVFSGDDPIFPVTITYSSPMSAAEVAEVKEFLSLWVRTLEREAAAHDGDSLT